jgi:hypothetical protein
VRHPSDDSSGEGSDRTAFFIRNASKRKVREIKRYGESDEQIESEESSGPERFAPKVDQQLPTTENR